MNSEVLYQANPNFILRTIAGQAVLVSVGDGVADFRGVITLNASAKVLWTLLKTGATKASLAEGLCREFAVTRETAEADVQSILDMLTEKGLVTCNHE